MPEISRFYGIVIKMYFNDHSPPHFHAIYGQDEAILNIETLAIIAGKLTPRALGLVTEWHQFIGKSCYLIGKKQEICKS